MIEKIIRSFVPNGTRFYSMQYPAMNRWAIFGKSLRDCGFKLAIERMFMSNAIAEKSPAKQRKNVINQIVALREQVEDLHDYLDLLEARARNKGKRTFSIAEARKQLGLG